MAFLTLPMIQWTPDGWRIVWFSESDRGWGETGADPDHLTHQPSAVSVLTRVAEGLELPVPRRIHRHEVPIDDIDGEIVWHRAGINTAEGAVTTELTQARRPSPDGGPILLTSDHQAMPLTAFATTAMSQVLDEPVEAVFYAGDCVNVPDRASEWFDLPSGNSFFQCLQGTAQGGDGDAAWPGSAILQHCPIYTTIGNHEVMGRVTGRNLDVAFNEPVPREVALAEFERVEGRRPTTPDDHRHVENDSWSIRTYQQVFGLESASDGWYSTRVGNVWLISLFATRAWRPVESTLDPNARLSNSRYHDAAGTQNRPLERGYGSFPFVEIGKGSRQYEWLVEQLAAPERQACRWTVVMLHEGPFGTGDNVMPPWSEPEHTVEHDGDGNRVGTRYQYHQQRNPLLTDLVPLFDEAGVNLVLSGHSHVWNRFRTDAGVNYLETSNVGNTYGSTEVALVRALPTAPWLHDDYLAAGSPAGMAPVPSTHGDITAIADDHSSVFSYLDTRTGLVRTWHASPSCGTTVLDEFSLGAG